MEDLRVTIFYCTPVAGSGLSTIEYPNSQIFMAIGFFFAPNERHHLGVPTQFGLIHNDETSFDARSTTPRKIPDAIES